MTFAVGFCIMQLYADEFSSKKIGPHPMSEAENWLVGWSSAFWLMMM